MIAVVGPVLVLPHHDQGSNTYVIAGVIGIALGVILLLIVYATRPPRNR